MAQFGRNAMERWQNGKRYLRHLVVHRLEPRGPRALLVAGQTVFACRIGRTGRSHAKREGDGATPVGVFALNGGWWRPDRRLPPRTGLALRPLRKNDGWCDAPGHRLYNRFVTLPFAASHEAMWRSDHQYDVVLDIDWNRHPRRQGRGSAIFLHLMSDNRGGTAGCVAVAPDRIDRLMARIGPATRIIIR
jgi:L,D-peptidoglycan transpeptidase YkuD (ErfK/YbiS/YcfS/YnhG family)